MRSAGALNVIDAALRVEHRDRVVPHAVDDQREPILAILQGLAELALSRAVLRDLHEADELAGGVVQGGERDSGVEERAILAQAPALALVAPLRARDLQLRLR